MVGRAAPNDPSDVQAAVSQIAASRLDGALIFARADRAVLSSLRDIGISDDDVSSALLVGAAGCARAVQALAWARTGWNLFHLAVAGDRHVLVRSAVDAVTRLVIDLGGRTARWQLALIRIVQGDAERTWMCDPEYDLTHIAFPGVAWVEPYCGPDWRESQKYPTVTNIPLDRS